jgi:general secretion pathway protein A
MQDSDFTHWRPTQRCMYYQYFGLTEAPFSIAVNPRYLFMSSRHRDALAHLLYGVGTGGGFILLTGEVGTGKTTINRCLLEQLPHDTDIAIILNPALNAMELLASACDELGIGYDPDKHTLKTLTDNLHRFLLDNHANGRKTVLLIDEAQHLDFDVLEQIRLLTNLETNSEKLLQIILIGQPELAQMLARPELRQLNQRITARYNLEPLNLEETGAYIHHRLQVAGMSADRVVFPRSVVKGIFQRTRGIPRIINVLCDRILLGAYGRNKIRADKSMLRLATREVMGEDSVASRNWLRSLGIFAVLGLAVAAAWMLLRPAGLRNIEQAPATVSIAAPAPALVAPPAENVAQPVEPEPAAVEEAVAQPDTDWLLPPPQSRAKLWSLYSTEPVPSEPCADVAIAGVACVQSSARTWSELDEFDRPLLLDLVTPERFAASVLMLGREGRNAWVATAQGVAQVDLGELGRLWTGSYGFLWHPPAGFERALAVGDSSEVVAAVAQLFARLDGEAQALTGPQFNAKLQQRVRLFQLDHGLDDDGVVGVQTLLKLNEQLGIDATAASARQALQGAASQVMPR